MWVFGYGSLTWKVNFPYSEQVPGFIQGYSRRFWQGSTDHRGVPGAPGRVATLVPASSSEKTWGIAYKVEPDKVKEVLDYLGVREKNGYETANVPFFARSESNKDSPKASFDVLLYIATSDNEHFLGPQPLMEMASQIARSHGPSGPNTEYLFRLADAIRDICPSEADTHLFQLEEAVRRMKETEL